jgi:hypothetical protein
VGAKTGFLKAGEGSHSSCKTRELINDTFILEKNLLPVRLVKIGKQLLVKVALEDIHTKATRQMQALVDSGCMRTCIDKGYARSLGFMLTKIPTPIKVEYVDGMTMEESTIRYSTNIRIRAEGATVVTRALVMRLKSAKVFLGFDWLQVVNLRINWMDLQIEVEEETTPLQMRAIDEVPRYTKTFEKVFSKNAFDELPLWRKWDHQINLILNHMPLRGRCYPLAAREKTALKDFVGMNLRTGKIKESDSPYTSPFFFRPKLGTGELRGIQDYRLLNEITVKDRYPLPLIWDVLNRVQDSKVFTKMDLRWGFNNIRIHEGNKHKATFIMPMGLFKPNVMHFGLCNAPSTFQRMVDEVLTEEKTQVTSKSTSTIF